MSSSLKIKICGLRRECDVDFVNSAGVDFVGFVFAGSKRQVTPAQASVLKKRLSPDIKSVGVFVNESIENIKRICKNGIIDLIQLHGNEDGDFIKTLKNEINLPVIKAVKALSKDYIKEEIRNDADFVLLDSFKENSFGGTGSIFDWTVVPDIKKPVFLAGGLNINNIKQAVDMVHPFCVDISSGVETDGFKDERKIFEITELVRGLEYEYN